VHLGALRQQDLHAHKGSSQQCCEAAAPGLNASLSSPISSSRSPRRSSSCSNSTTRFAAAEARREGARRGAAKREAEEAKREAEEAKRDAQEAKRNAEAEAEAEEWRASMRARVDALLTALARARVLEGRVQQQALAEGAWLLHCWGRAKSAAPVLLRVHVKLTGLLAGCCAAKKGRWALRRGAVWVGSSAGGC